MTDQHLPSIWRQAKNFTVAFTKWVAAGRPIRSAEHIEDLFKICEKCPTRRFMRLSQNKGRCTKCGCWVKRAGEHRNKLAWPTEGCPEGHWAAQVDPEQEEQPDIPSG